MIEITVEDYKALILVLFKNKLLIFIFTIAGLCAGMFYFARQPIAYTYNATATVSVVFDAGVNQGQFTGIGVIAGYADIITSYRVAAYAASILESEGITAEQIQNMTTKGVGQNSPIMSITARNASPRLAIMTANAVAESFVTQIAIITGNNSIQVLDAARTANISISPLSHQIRLIAPVAAFIIACVLIVIIELSSGKIRSVRQCVTDINELAAVIPKVDKKR